jgi:hypothetical protein
MNKRRGLLAALTTSLVAAIPSARGQEAGPPAAPGPLALGDSKVQLVYTPVAPCRIVDTRLAGGPLTPGSPRQFRLTGLDLSAQGGNVAGCNVPFARATVAFVNFVAVNPAGAGNLRAWAYSTPPLPAPNSSVLNYALVAGAGLNIANAIALPICDPSVSGQACPLDFRVQADGSATQMVADVVGFFERVPTEQLPGLAIPTGTVILWDQSNECPAGYTRAGTFDGRWLRGSSSPGGTGGAETHTHDLGHVHEMGGHTHGGTTFGGNAGAGSNPDSSEPEAPRGSHTHTLGTVGPSPSTTGAPSVSLTGTASNVPAYADVLFCRKDAPPPPAPHRQARAPRSGAGPLALGDSRAHLLYTPVTPCRIIDTRAAGGSLAVGAPREFSVTDLDLSPQGGSPTGCNIPFNRATAALVNFVAVNPTGAGNLRAWAYRTPPPPPPNSSVLNYAFVAGAGLNVANGIAVPICDPSESGQACPLDFRAQADGNSTHVVADVVGFFERFPAEEVPDLTVPTGAVVIWDQSATCPAGYARAGGFDGLLPRGAAAVGGTGGADSHTHAMSHFHGMSNHTHSGGTGGGFGGGGLVGGGGVSVAGLGHSHPLTTGGPSTNSTDTSSAASTESASNLPPYFDVLFCRRLPPALQAKAPAAPAAPKGGETGPLALGDSNAQLVYTPAAPCRIIDTRLAGGSLAAGAPRSFRVTGNDLSGQGGSASGCGVPQGRTAAAIINFVAVNPGGAGNLRAWAFRDPPAPPPNSSVLNYAFVAGAGLNIANAIALPVCDPSQPGQMCGSDFQVRADGNGTHLVADVVGFFERFPNEEVPGLAVPAGAVVVWDQSGVCPVGYTRVGALDGRFLRGAATPGGTGGAASHVHGISHTHGLGTHTHSGTTGVTDDKPGTAGGPQNNASSLSHAHNFTTAGPSSNLTNGPGPGATSSASSLPPYADVLFCRKD